MSLKDTWLFKGKIITIFVTYRSKYMTKIIQKTRIKGSHCDILMLVIEYYNSGRFKVELDKLEIHIVNL